jgi:hypothetical protein
MIVTSIDQGKHNFTLNGTCPHCGRLSVFVEVTTKYMERDHNGFLDTASVMLCQGCKKPILALLHFFQSNGDLCRYVAHYPIGKPEDNVDPEIPEAIAADFKEALRCLWVDAYNATAEMCRRAMEASCIDLGAPISERWLEDKIDWLESQRKITPFLRDVAHKIRLGGNRAAHPGNVQPAATSSSQSAQPEPIITKEHAVAIVKFSREFFHHVYVVPKQLDKYDFSKPRKAGP